MAYIVFKAVLAVGLWGAAATGFLKTDLALWERALATGAFSLVLALPMTDEIGFVLSALFVVQHYWRARRQTRGVGDASG